MQWNDIEKIVSALEENYHEQKIDNLRIDQLHELIISLHDFDDDIEEYPTRILNTILESWQDVRSEK